MNTKEIYNLVVESLEFIQEFSGQEKVPINRDTVPIGQLPGFDTLSGVELVTVMSKHMPIGKRVRLCVSDDGKKPLSVREIVDKVTKLDKATSGGKKDAKGQ